MKKVSFMNQNEADLSKANQRKALKLQLKQLKIEESEEMHSSAWLKQL